VASTCDAQSLTAAVKALAKDCGAVLVGVASIDRFDPRPPYFDRAPAGHDPRDFLPGARSVISIAQPILPAVLDGPAALMDREVDLVPPDAKRGYLDETYGISGHRVQDFFLEFIGQRVGQLLLEHGYDAMFFPTTSIGPVRTHVANNWREVWDRSPFRSSPGPFSHRHAATRAGLGEFGLNNLVLTREFGPRQRFNSIVTDAQLAPDPLIDKPICLRQRCGLCLKACYMNAILMRDDKSRLDYRSVEKVDLDCIFIDTPTRTHPVECDSRTEPGSPCQTVRGDCARICPIPRLSRNLPKRLQAIVGGALRMQLLAGRNDEQKDNGDSGKGLARNSGMPGC
jgi:epoxyqueuosine reductase QueG